MILIWKDAPPRLSINVGTSEADLNNKDIELGFNKDDVVTNVGRYKSLSISPSHIHASFRVIVGILFKYLYIFII